jgi:hypothetical protein
MTFRYTPDKDLKVHEEGAIKLICAPFQSHESGLPEWAKNSADAYAREDSPEKRRIIVIIFDYGRKNVSSSISCLDFVGMTTEDIENYFRHWADPNAAVRDKKRGSIQGGHGNGGKCYMTQMFTDYSQVYTVKNAKGNRYGVPGGSIKFGYIPDQEKGRNFTVNDISEELERVLNRLRCSIDSLPKAAIDSFKTGDGFSIFTGYGPKNYGKKIPASKLIRDLRDHPQMVRTLETCKVYVIVNGKLSKARKPITLPKIKPLSGAERPRIIEIPSKLKDPLTGDTVSTTDEGKLGRGKLILMTSEKSMRRKMKFRHTIRFQSVRLGDFGYVPVSELDVQSPYRDYIYGICKLESLEKYKQNVRARLAESPLTRSVEQFISEQLQAYAKEFEARDRKKYNQEEKNAVCRINEALDRWKNRFLKEIMHGMWGSGGEGQPPPQIPLTSGKVAKIELILSHNKVGLGITIRPRLIFYDENGRKIQAVPHRWVSDDNNIAMVDNDLMLITTFSYGKTFIYAETLDGKVRSNTVPLEVIHIKEITIKPDFVELSQGSRVKLEAFCKVENNEIINGVLLDWAENDSSIARVSSSGMVYGFNPGDTKVCALDNNCISDNITIKVVSGEGRGTGSKSGKGFPKVLISGEFDVDPDTKEYVHFSADDPPVWQRPEDYNRNIWWINSSAPLAVLYLDKDKGYGYDSSEWRMYHLERYIDIIVQITLTQGPLENESNSSDYWIREWMSIVADIQAAAVSDLREFLTTGQLPR